MTTKLSMPSELEEFSHECKKVGVMIYDSHYDDGFIIKSEFGKKRSIKLADKNGKLQEVHLDDNRLTIVFNNKLDPITRFDSEVGRVITDHDEAIDLALIRWRKENSAYLSGNFTLICSNPNCNFRFVRNRKREVYIECPRCLYKRIIQQDKIRDKIRGKI